MTVRLLEACLAKLPRPAHEQPQEILEFACAVQQQLIQLGKIEVLVRELREAISLFDGGSVTSTCLHKHAIWLGVEAWNTGARLIQAGSPGGDWLHQSRHLLQLLKKSDLAELAGAGAHNTGHRNPKSTLVVPASTTVVLHTRGDVYEANFLGRLKRSAYFAE
eukprot:3864769-Amphidinium_carterae.2